MALSGNAAIPAVDSRRRVMAHLTGRRIVQMVKDDLKPSDVLTREAFENAIRVNGAIGGSTNAVIHLLAIAGRVGVDLTLDDWDRLGRDVPDHRQPDALGPVPDGGVLLCRRPAGGHPRARRGGPAAQGRAHRLGRPDLGRGQGGAQLERGCHPPGRQGADRVGRHRRAARQPRARRGGAEALGGVAAPDDAPRPGGRVRGHRRLQGADRRRSPRHRRDLRHGAEELRAAGLSRHGRGRQHGAAAEGAAQGHHRHGAHLRRAHVGHRLRHRRPAHLARGGARRPARGGADRRHDRARRAGAAACTSTSPRRNSRGGWPRGSRRWSGRAAATASSTTTTWRGRHRRRPRLPQGLPRRAVGRDSH